MAIHAVKFNCANEPVFVKTGTLLTEAAKDAGIDLGQPCGGQGRCGRCVVQILSGSVRSRSALLLSQEDIADGFVLACQAVVEGDVTVKVPDQEAIERRLTTDRFAVEVEIPIGYRFHDHQTLHRVQIQCDTPSYEDQVDDLNRLRRSIKIKTGYTEVKFPLHLIKKLSSVLRSQNWQITIIYSLDESPSEHEIQVVDILPGQEDDYGPIWGAAIDIGTTTVSLWLVDLTTGKVHAQVAEYNGQIKRGEDVISRIIFADKQGGLEELQKLIIDTINKLIRTACQKVKKWDVHPDNIMKVSVAGNSTMLHLFLGVPPTNIRLAPFITTFNNTPLLTGREIGIGVCPGAIIDCLPAVASFVGADISSGVFSSGMDYSDKLTLFLDVGTNGEMVLGSKDWLVTCACSAGPAFEGAGVRDGMRATTGAIEEVWINKNTGEASYRVIGSTKPRGICGSGLLALLAELFVNGIIDKAGNFTSNYQTPRIREGEHGMEYIVAWGKETHTNKDIVITRVDIDNLLRAKAAIYAGFAVLAQSVGVTLDSTEQILIGGSFGKYINIEKSIQIGLLPDLDWERFQFLGNTSIKGAYYALLNKNDRERIEEIASRMTYIELSADNTFYEAFMSALFLPHTDLLLFPTVASTLQAMI